MKKLNEPFIEGEHYLSLGLVSMAKERFQHALKNNRQKNNLEGVGVCLFYLAQTAVTEKNKAEALKYLEDARAIYRQRGHDQMLIQLNHLENAIQALEEEAQVKQIPEPEPEIKPLDLFKAGKTEAAISIFEKNIQHFRKSDNQIKLAQALLNSGQCQFAVNQTDMAIEHLNEARELAFRLKHEELSQAIDDAFQAIQLVSQQKEIDRQSIAEIVKNVNEPDKRINLLLSKAEISILKHHVKDTETAIHEARKCIPQQNAEKYMALIMLVEVKLLRLKDKFQQASQVLKYALELAAKIGDSDLVQLIQETSATFSKQSG